MRVSDDQASRLRIRSGAEKVFVYSQAGVGVPAGVAPEGETPPPAENVASEAPPESTKNEGEK
jgi:hypothetical protein